MTVTVSGWIMDVLVLIPLLYVLLTVTPLILAKSLEMLIRMTNSVCIVLMQAECVINKHVFGIDSIALKSPLIDYTMADSPHYGFSWQSKLPKFTSKFD